MNNCMVVRFVTSVAALFILSAVVESRADDAASNSCSCSSVTAKEMFGMENPANSPLAIEVKLEQASLKEGIKIHVEIANKGTNAFSLAVCPSVGLCCVEGMHPLLGYDNTGVGLLDLCRGSRPPTRECSLPAGASLSFGLLIPDERIPVAARKKNKEISVLLCYELDKDNLLHSNVIKAVLTE